MAVTNDRCVVLQIQCSVDVDFDHHIRVFNCPQHIVFGEVTQLTLDLLRSDLTLAVKAGFAFNEFVVVPVTAAEALPGDKSIVSR